MSSQSSPSRASIGRRRIAISNPSGADAVGQYSISCSVIFSLIEPVAYGRDALDEVEDRPLAEGADRRLVSRVVRPEGGRIERAHRHREERGRARLPDPARERRRVDAPNPRRLQQLRRGIDDAEQVQALLERSAAHERAVALHERGRRLREIARDARLHLLRTDRLDGTCRTAHARGPTPPCGRSARRRTPRCPARHPRTGGSSRPPSRRRTPRSPRDSARGSTPRRPGSRGSCGGWSTRSTPARRPS